MTEEQDDIIILEEADEEDKSSKTAQEKADTKEEETKKINKKNIIIIASLSVFLLIVVVFLVILLIKKKDKNSTINVQQLTQKIIKKEGVVKFAPLKIENLIKKASILYAKGDKKDAINIYKEIATYNESISNYNIGVAKMKGKKYKDAIKYFKKAILNGQNRCVSAINSAVCAIKMGNQTLFEYYINLAKIYLPYESSSPLYSYYMALINYYKGYYFESLIPMRHPTSKYYISQQNYLSSKVDTFFGDNLSAINFLEKNEDFGNDLTLGLLYAKIGEYNIAIQHFKKSYNAAKYPLRSLMAMALSYIKIGLLSSSAKDIKNAVDLYKSKSMDIYPIAIKLKPSLYDISLAQKNYEKNIFLKKENEYGLMFYFAPYKIFNANQTIQFIRKGSLSLSLGETKDALNLLSQSAVISKINKNIAIGIKKALSFKVNEANKIFNSLRGKYPDHSILYYDLGLSYAQMGNYTKAYVDFVKSYHLDSKNYLAGVFAIITKSLIHKDNEKLIQEVVSDINSDKSIKNKKFFLGMIDFSRNNILSAANFAESDTSDKALNLIFDAIVAKNIKNKALFLKKATKLQDKMPKDMVAELIFTNAKMQGQDAQKYAKAIQENFLNKSIDFKSLFYGPVVARNLYIKSLQISGMLYYIRDILEKQLEDENTDVTGIMQALAYVDIYTKNYEESYAIYNELIDTYKIEDSNTLFLASVAAIGAGHDANAIALLELAKLTDPNNFESRFALGILYLEVKNPEAAIIQFDKIGNSGFISRYFTFRLVKKEL